AMRAMGHRDDELGTFAGAVAFEERREDLRHGTEPSRREVGNLDGRQGRSGVPERAGPAEVVEVVARAPLVTAADAETRDRAVDGPFRHVVGADAEPRRDAGPKR